MKVIKKIIAVATIALLLPIVARAADAPTIYCGVYSMSSWGDNKQQGIYSFVPGSEISFTKVSPQTSSAGLVPLGGAAVYDGVMHSVYYTAVDDGYSFLYQEHDINTWERTSYKFVTYSNLASTCNVTLNPKDKKVYGQFYNFNLDFQVVNRKFAVIDYATQTKTVIGDPMTEVLVATFCSQYGDLYGISKDGNLLYIDKTDGETTNMGSLGLSLNSAKPMSAITDYTTGKTYFAAQTSDGKSALYEISRYPVGATLVGEFPDAAVVVNMYIENMEVVPPVDPKDATPVAPTDVKLSYDASSKLATLTWTAPTTSKEKVALDPSTLTYKIVRMPDNETVATAHASTTFTETIDGTGRDLKAYYYFVYPLNGTIVGDSAQSNAVAIGEALVPPYFEPFTDAANFNLFTVVDANGDGATWKHCHYEGTYTGTIDDYATIEADQNNADDDYLLTPPLRLMKGGRYELSFVTRKNYSPKNYDQRMRVLVGTGTDVTTYKEIIEPFDITEVNNTRTSTMVNIDEDGIYHIAFHALSNAGSSKLVLDSINLAASLDVYGPDSVTNLQAVADPEGNLKATISFNAPTKNMHGDDLTSLTRIDVTDKATGKVYATIAEPTPGNSYSTLIEGTTNGYNTIEVVAYLDDLKGQPNEVTLFIGQDLPLEPTNVQLRDGGEQAVLSWVAPTVGVNGLALNPALLTYNLYDIDDEGYAVEKQRNITSPFNTGDASATGDQQLLYYAIDAENAAGWSNPVASNSIVIGAPYALPYNESFTGGTLTSENFVWLEGDASNFGLYKQLSSDDDQGSVIYMPSSSSKMNYVSFNTGKYSLAGAPSPTLTFDYYCMPSTSSSIGVLVETFPQDGETDLLTTLALDGVEEAQWKTATVDLSAYVNEPYIIVKFLLVSNSMSEYVVLDNIRMTSTSSIGQLSIDAPATDGPIYNLQGQRVVNPAPGIYIQNGKKVVVR